MVRSFHHRIGVCVPALFMCLAFATSLRAVEPEIRNISLRGLQIGGSTTLVIDGDNFGTAPRLLLPFAAKTSLKSGSTDKQATFEVVLGAEVSPGYHQLRVVNDNGVSLPNVVAVDRLLQKAFVPSIEQLPVALHGTIAGSNVVETNFPGKAGQKILIEVEAQRLGNKLRPTIHLYGPKRLQLNWAWSNPALQGDARLEATLPEDGAYRITLHDAEYAAPAPGFFRMRVGRWSYVDQVFPTVVGKETTNVELLGSDGGRAEVPTARQARWLPLAWPKEGVWSGPRPFVETSSRTELLEQSVSGKLQDLPAGTVGVSGRLSAPFEEDRYRVPVTPGAKVRFEVFAERLGSPIDAALVIRNESGAELTRVEDSPGTLDPLLEYTVPANVNAVIVGIIDPQGRGGARGFYRLTVDPVVAANARNEFDLVTPARRISLPAEGRTVVPVWIERRGFTGAVELSATGLPAVVKLEGLKIPAGADGALVTISSGNAPPSPVLITFQGRADDGRERAVMQKNHPLERVQPWLASELALGGSSEKAKDLLVDWKDSKEDDGLVNGRRWAANVKLTRSGMAAPVRLTVLTSQLPVLLNNQPDPNKTIRQEKPIEVPANAADSEIALLLPADLTGEMYDVTIQAESLSADKKTVTATAFTPVRRLPVRWPLVVKLEGTGRYEVKPDAKTGGFFEIVGTVERLPGITGDVQITLAPLPGGVTAPPVTVKADASGFKMKVTHQATVPAGEIKGLKLTAAVVPDPKPPAQRIRSKELEVTVNVLPSK